MQMRLNELGALGIPLWLTEFDSAMDDLKGQAQLYENVLRLAFSHPNVHGIVLWGFYDETNDRAALMHGPDFQVLRSTCTGI